MSDFQLAIKTFAMMFSLCAVLCVVALGIDALSHIELAGDLIKGFSAIMLSCVTGITGMLARRLNDEDISNAIDEVPGGLWKNGHGIYGFCIR